MEPVFLKNRYKVLSKVTAYGLSINPILVAIKTQLFKSSENSFKKEWDICLT